MGMLKLGFLAGVAFLAAIAIYMGLMILLTSLKLGSITLDYNIGPQAITDTVTRAGEPGRFWQLLMAMGVLPLVGGAAAMWYAVRKLRGN
jgi:hypothetical protein